MVRAHRRTVKTRQPKEVQVALGASGLWLVVIFFYVSSFYLGRPSEPTWVIVCGAATVVAWTWAVSAIRKRNAAGKTLEELQALSPDQFEEWVGARFRDLGYSARVTGRGGDHGADLIAEKAGETAIVQCKRFKSWSVGEPVLRDLLGAMHDFGASRAYLVTTGRLTQAAKEWAKGKPIEVWDGDKVVQLSARLASESTGSPQTKASETVVVQPPQPSAVPEGVASADIAATCPRCGSALVERRNRRTGEAFLGCTRYPQCHFTRPLSGAGKASST